jgi:dihydrolipoamide dehydrogenase
MYDVIVIGSGPGGYVTGIRASQLGMKACVIEKNNLGGVCLNVGCIPTKNLIHQAELFGAHHELTALGVKVNTQGLKFDKVIQNSKIAVKTLVKGVAYLLKKNKVDLIKATAKITGPNSVILDDGREIQGKNIVIATGSRPFQLPGFEFDEQQVLSSTGALNLKKLPKSMVILGAGAIGCEFAYVLNSFGVEVQLVEMAEHILPFEDAETVSVLADQFQKKGIEIHTQTRALKLEKKNDSITVTVEKSDGSPLKLEAEQALCVFGRIPNTDDIGLESIGIDTEKGCIPVNNYYQTKVKGIFAIGDVLSTPQLAHVASREGEIAMDYLAGLQPEPRINSDDIVSAIYCEPQIASFGLREEQTKAQNIPYTKAIFPYSGLGKAVAIGKTEGLVKLLVDAETHELLGAHIVGHTATELIHELLLAKRAELLPEDITRMIHAHPTISEAIIEAMREVNGEAIHI